MYKSTMGIPWPPLTILVAALLTITKVTAMYPDVQSFDIFSGEHLDDTILPSDGNKHSFIHAVLVIYQPDCVHLLQEYKMGPNLLPLSKYVLLLYHDYFSSNTNTWYGFSGDDLRNRYDASQCLDVLFIPRGSTSLSSTVRWDLKGELSFKDWVWQQIVVPVHVANHYGDEVRIRTLHSGHSEGPRQYPDVRLNPAQTTTLQLYESTVVHIYTKGLNTVTNTTDDKLIGYWIVNGSLTINVIPSKMTKLFEEVMFDIQEDTKVKDYQVLEVAWNTMQRHLLNLKQPLVVPQFTDTGYKKIDVPEEWFSVLRNFYDTHQTERVHEGWKFGDSVINQQEVQCSMVWLSEEVKNTVAEGLRKLMQEWCGVELEMTAFYGVREYFGGNVLHNHVDRLDTHVISAIIQIDKDLGGEEDWTLEVIEYGGHRNIIQLEPGEMLLYESARLIHGRPKAFKGKRYANVFLHYRPKFDWENKFHHDASKFTLYYPETNEKLMPLKSDLTDRHGRKRDMKEIPSHAVGPGKDEL